ncbi:MAG: sulfatase-like hydrolase/transferase, partial [Myxococcota bacterium]
MIILLIFLTAVLALLVVRFVPQPWRGRILNVLKAFVTVGAFWLLLSHPVTMEDGSKRVAGALVLDTLANINAATFWTFCGLAAGVKFVGILASMYRWTVLLRGQGIELPFPHIFGSFLIGRFIGTFLPSTAGLDGYKLYDAARFSGRTVEVTAATALEKVIGVSGIFITFLVSAPFGIQIFGDNATIVAVTAIPISLAIIVGLMTVLFFPGFVQWLVTHIPIPGKARLEGLVLRISNAAAAYRDKQGLIFQAFGLSFVVHFTTAAMYFFTALAIGATAAEFWPVVFGSSIQILATVISPFTIAGEGIREAAQYLLLSNMIGPANAIVSAALGFWAAEALTLAGGVFWWIRPAHYRPAYCLVNGQQVDFDEAAKTALDLETEEERAVREAAPASAAPPLAARARLSGGAGFGAGVIGGLVIGAVEAFVIAQGGFGGEAQVLWYGPLLYAAVLGGLGLLGGLALAILPMDADEIRGWTPSLALIATFVPLGLAITLFRLRRDVYLEQMPPAPVLLGVLGAAGVLALALFFLGPRLFRGPAGRMFRPATALGALAIVVASGAVLGGTVGGGGEPAAGAGAVPAQLADRPNLILVMVDTLRADHLSCYDAPGAVDTPNLCRLVRDGGSIFDAFAHASWTKPSTATLLTSLLPSSHGAMSKPAALSEEVTLVPEVLKEQGYATGGIVTNTNLAESFGFDQGYDEYHYLAPDYLFGASESSSKLILYQIARRVFFRVKPGLRVGDFYQSAETVNGVAFDFLQRHEDRPFFLFL